MVTLRGIFLTLKTVENFWNVVFLYVFGKPFKIKFRGLSDPVIIGNKSEFRALRYVLLRGWKFIERRENYYIIEKGGIKFINYYTIEEGGIKLTKSEWILMFGGAYETISKSYAGIDYTGKTVLDVGGFLGETAIYFNKNGAKKIIIYEPVPEFFEVLNLVLSLNSVSADSYNVGVGEEDGKLEVYYEKLDDTFGLIRSGSKKKEIKVTDVKKVLKDNIDIAKFNCEGCEYSLLSVPNEILRRIPFYIIQYHSDPQFLFKKFKEAGFNCKIIGLSRVPSRGFIIAQRRNS